MTTKRTIESNEFWTQDEIDELYAGARQLAEDLDLDDEFVETVVRRAMDAREFPEKMLSIDDFAQRCEEMGIYCSHCGNADSDCQWCMSEFEREESEESNGSGSEAS